MSSQQNDQNKVYVRELLGERTPSGASKWYVQWSQENGNVHDAISLLYNKGQKLAEKDSCGGLK